jgi:hypothetical protein
MGGKKGLSELVIISLADGVGGQTRGIGRREPVARHIFAAQPAPSSA